MNFTLPTKVLITLGAAFFLVGFLGLFFIEARATVQDVNMLSFHQQGYSGIPHSRYGSRRNSTTGDYIGIGIGVVKYEYHVESESFSGIGLANDYNGETVSIKYSSIAPSISISSSSTYFLVGLFFLFLATGVRSIVLWARRVMGKN